MSADLLLTVFLCVLLLVVGAGVVWLLPWSREDLLGTSRAFVAVGRHVHARAHATVGSLTRPAAAFGMPRRAAR